MAIIRSSSRRTRAWLRTGPALLAVMTAQSAVAATSPALELFVDSATKQVYTEPGPDCVLLGRFVPVENGAARIAGADSPIIAAPVALPVTVATAPVAAPQAAGAAPAAAKPKWYDRLSLRGYTQFHYNEVLDNALDDYRHYADRSWSDNQSFFIRRSRVILSGDVSDQLSIYIQPDFAVTPPGSSQTHFVQLRDAYGDIAFDAAKTLRLRIGQSKVPYGFENLQSSQNHLALDRNDAFNSVLKDKRDIGAFLYWAPAHIRALFKSINERGLKGSGDYGVVGVGIYNGQGANRFEANDQFHTVARVSWPRQFDNGQIFEMGVQALNGRFAPSVAPGIALDVTSDGLQDGRYGLSALLDPQPFGLQAEWNWGHGPELTADGRRVRVASLNGGYVQAMYREESPWGVMIPFVRWQYFDGAMKFEHNVPATHVSETEFGLEWQIRPEIELTTMYVLTDRTNVLVAPYEQLSGDLLRFQMQWNY